MSETVEYKGREIEIYRSEFHDDPREWDNIGKMICFHGRYNLGDKHNYDDPTELAEEVTEKDHIILPLYLYDHGGITMNTVGFSCNWDSGQVGVIYTNLKMLKAIGHDFKEITPELRKKVEGWLKEEVKTYDQYLTGEVYSYNTERDSCGGFYGDDHEASGLLPEARSIIDYEIEGELKDRQTKLKALIKARVPLYLREKILN